MHSGRIFILLFSLLFLNTAYADDKAMALLSSMATAAKELNYQGVFAYQSGKNLQSIQIFHRSDARGELERLISLNGEAREVIRNNDMVTCINPKGKKVNISRRPLGRGFPSDLPRRLNSASPFYQVVLGQEGRVAGRAATELLIQPIDDYRYGYRLWVDKESNLLLKAELLASSGDVLEMIAFSSLETGIHIPEQQFEPQMSGEELSWHQVEREKPAPPHNHDAHSRWQLVWLPEGFALVATQERMRASNGAHVEQRVYSDGLSSVSVFIEKIRAQHGHLHGGSRMGAINAFGSIMQSHFVTVVGEVPAKTVEKIGAAIRFVESERHD